MVKNIIVDYLQLDDQSRNSKLSPIIFSPKYLPLGPQPSNLTKYPFDRSYPMILPLYHFVLVLKVGNSNMMIYCQFATCDFLLLRPFL